MRATGTASGGHTPWFTMSSSSPPSARAASSTARWAAAGSPRSPPIATALTRPRPPSTASTALTVSSASARLLKYPTATLAPARASSSAVARPMPRPPPVTKARFPAREITAPPQRGSRNAEPRTAERGTRKSEQQWRVAGGTRPGLLSRVPRAGFRVWRFRVPASAFRGSALLEPKLFLNDFTNHVLDGQVQLLNVGGLVGRDDEAVVDQLAGGSAVPAEQRHDPHAFGSRRLRGAQHVGTLAAGGVQHHEITGAGQRFDLAGEDLVEAQVVAAGREERRVGGEGDRRQGAPVVAVADDVFGGQVLGVRGAAAVPRKKKRAAPLQRLDVPAGQPGNVVGVALGHTRRERREPGQARPRSLRRRHRLVPRSPTARTNAAKFKPAASTATPFTPKSAPPPWAARAFH